MLCISAAYAVVRCLSVRPSVWVSVTFVHSVETNNAGLSSIFTARRVCIARTMPSQDVRLSVRLSVGLSHAGIESKRLYISSKFFTVG